MRRGSRRGPRERREYGGEGLEACRPARTVRRGEATRSPSPGTGATSSNDALGRTPSGTTGRRGDAERGNDRRKPACARGYLTPRVPRRSRVRGSNAAPYFPSTTFSESKSGPVAVACRRRPANGEGRIFQTPGSVRTLENVLSRPPSNGGIRRAPRCRRRPSSRSDRRARRRGRRDARHRRW